MSTAAYIASLEAALDAAADVIAGSLQPAVAADAWGHVDRLLTHCGRCHQPTTGPRIGWVAIPYCRDCRDCYRQGPNR